MLGFRGHFASKSRRYSTTLTKIRGTRRRFQRAKTRNPHGVIDVAALNREDQDQTTLVIGSWRFAGTGWLTDEDTAMAVASAARAREKAQGKFGKHMETTKREDRESG